MYNDKCRNYNSYQAIKNLSYSNNEKSKTKKQYKFSEYHKNEKNLFSSNSNKKKFKK